MAQAVKLKQLEKKKFVFFVESTISSFYLFQIVYLARDKCFGDENSLKQSMCFFHLKTIEIMNIKF